MLKWISESFPWTVFVVLAITGGIVAHIRTYEQAKVDLSFKAHFWAIIRRSVVSGFAGLLVYLAVDGFGLEGSPWGYFAAGLCGLFSAEAFDLMWRLGTAYLQGRVNIQAQANKRRKDD